MRPRQASYPITSIGVGNAMPLSDVSASRNEMAFAVKTAR